MYLSSKQSLERLKRKGSNTRNDPGVLLVYSESTRRAEHAHICEISQRVQILKLRHSEFGYFDPEMKLFFG